MTKIERKSRVVDEMRQTAGGLHDAGLITRRRLGEFDPLCNLDVAETAPQSAAGVTSP